MANIEFITREQGRIVAANGGCAIDVSSYGEHPFKTLSPFSYSEDFRIPVPGMPGRFSYSVEGIWQGLKIINGETGEHLFEKRPRKRKGIVEGHKYGDQVLNVTDAREKIYIPSYTYYVNNYAQEAMNIILDEQRKERIFVYDVESNGDISKPEPLAHASVLAFLLNAKIFSRPYTPVSEAEKKLSSVLDSESPLEQKIEMLKNMLGDAEIKNAFRYRCIEHPKNPDDFHIGEYFSK